MQQQQLVGSLAQVFSLATVMKLVSSLVGGGSVSGTITDNSYTRSA